MELLRSAVTRSQRGESLALVTVIQVSGSVPRHLGARMLVDETGAIEHTIGGGRVEMEVTQAAAEVAAGAPMRQITHHLTRDLAMCCGGSMTFLIEPVAPGVPALREALERRANRRPCLLVTPLSGEPKHIREMPTPPLARSACDENELVEPIVPAPRMVLMGGGHVAREIGPMAARIGFEVIVCDDGETGALDILQADAPSWLHGTVDSFDIRDVEAEIGKLGLSDHALIVTRDHAVDQAILEQLIGNTGLSYLGLIGSRRKIARFRQRLQAKGLFTEERWARLRAPIGLDIGAETPVEIAIAVVAELVQERRRGRA